MRLHCVALPHTQTTSSFLSCAYTQKIVKFCPMMMRQGYEVILYSGEHNEAICSEHVPLITESTRRKHFGAGFDTVKGALEWDAKKPYWIGHNRAAIREIKKRFDERDMLCLVTGWPQKPIADAFPRMQAVEWAVGYSGIFTSFRAFESYSWMSHVYGLNGIVNGHFYDDVIPNFFEPDDFAIQEKEDYLLYIGRLVSRKGPHIALEIAQRAGLPLLVAGPGVDSHSPGQIVYPEGKLEGDVHYVGEVGKEERARLMGAARATIVPTLYIEPFGGVAVESMFAGTPVLTTDWGAFPETVTPDVGRRFRTLPEAMIGLDKILKLKPEKIRASAIARYSTDVIGERFNTWLRRVNGLWGTGVGDWYGN